MSQEDHRREDRSLVKVVIRLDEADWHDHATEAVWAAPVGPRWFRIRSVPFYAYGLSYDDTVAALETADGRLVDGVLGRGGHSTYRLFVTDGEQLKLFPDCWGPLELLGCTLERATARLYAVDIPPEADIREAYRLLEVGQAEGVWDFEEAHMGHRLDPSG